MTRNRGLLRSETRHWHLLAAKVRIGLGRDKPLFRFIAEMLPLKFHFPEAVIHLRMLPTHCGYWQLG